MEEHSPGIPVELVIEPGAEPVRGRLWPGTGREQGFWGWLELMSLLTRASDDPGAGGGTEREDHP